MGSVKNMFAVGHTLNAIGQFLYHLFSTRNHNFFQLSDFVSLENFGTRFVNLLSEITKQIKNIKHKNSMS